MPHLLRTLPAVGIVLTLSAPSAIAQTSSGCTLTLQSLVDAAPAGSTVNVPACTYHENVVVSKALTLDGHNTASFSGDNVRDRWIQIYSSDVSIHGFKMLDADTALQEGAICTCLSPSTNIVIDGNDLGATKNGSQVGIGGTTNSKVTNNQIHDGGQLGIETYLNTGLLIQGNHIWHNNTAGVDPNFGAGGIKAVQDTNSQILGNEIDRNAGPGVWCDIACTGETIANNNIHDQTWNPIFYEISSFGDIYGNTVSASNTNPFPGGNWGCIVVSSSGDTNVHDNTCLDALPLRAQLDNRTDLPLDAGRNVKLQNNRMVRPVPSQATSWWQWDPNGPLVPGTNGNVDAGNQVLLSLPTSTPLPTATVAVKPTAIPTVACEVNVKIAGKEQGWKKC